jgi:two-component system OmpR family response regulator
VLFRSEKTLSPHQSENRSEHPTILIVEDESLISWSIANALTKVGYTVLSVDSAEEAMNIFHIRNIDLLISDINLPHLDGIEFVKTMRSIYPGIPVIIMTANDEEYGSKLPVIRDIYFREKPFLLAEIVRLVDSILSKPRIKIN